MNGNSVNDDTDVVSRYNALSSLAPPSRRNSTNNNNTGNTTSDADGGDANSLSSKRSLDDELASLASEIDEVIEDTQGEFEAAARANGTTSIAGGVVGGGHLPNGADLTGSDAAALIGAALSDDLDDHVDNTKGDTVEDDNDVGYLHDDAMDRQVGVQEVAAALAAAAAEEEDEGGVNDACMGSDPEPPLISQAVEEALSPPAGPEAEEPTRQSSRAYTSLTDIDPSHFRKPWEVPSRHSSSIPPDKGDGDANVDVDATSITSASHQSIEDELASLASEMEEVLEEELAAEQKQAMMAHQQYRDGAGSRNSLRRGRNTFEDEGQVGTNSSTAYLYQDEQDFGDGRYEVGGGEIDQETNGIGDDDGYVYDEDNDAVHNAVGTLWGGGGGGGGPSSFTANVPNSPASDPNFMEQYQHSQSRSAPSSGNGSAVGSVASSAASAISSTAQKARTRLSKFTQNASMLSSQRVGSSSSVDSGAGSSANATDDSRPYIPPWQRKGANGSSSGTNAHDFAGPIGASMQMDLEQAAQIDAYRQGLINRLEDGEKVPSGAKGMGSRSKQAAVESYRRLIMQWILPVKVQVARQFRDGSVYLDSRLGCLSRLTGCSKQKIAFIFVAAGLYVTANIISNVEDGVRLIEKIGVKFGKASDAVFEVAEDSATEAVDAAVNMFGGDAAGSPPPPNVLLPDYWELLSDFEIPFHHVVPNIPGQRRWRRLQEVGQLEETPLAQPVLRRQQAIGIPIAGGANAATPLQQQSDVPFFFHFPRSGGSTLLEIMSSCIGLVLASDVGARDGHGSDPNLQVIETPVGSYVNVDTNSQAGLERAIELKLLDSGLVDVVSSNIPISALKLFEFSPQYRGKMFVLLRNPVERAASQFFELQKHDRHYARMSIEKYASSRKDEADFNIMTKTLVDKPGLTTGSLTEDDLNTAKEILRRKALVGLLSDKGDTVLRFERYFGWTYDTAEDKTCSEKLLHWEWKNKGEDNGPIAEDSKIYQDLAARNAFDVELYAYAVKLFKEQGAVLHGEGVEVN